MSFHKNAYQHFQMGCASGKAFENPDNIDTSLHQRHQHKSNQSRINGQKSGD